MTQPTHESSEWQACRWCGQPTLRPSGCCSNDCHEQLLGETRADYDMDERRPDRDDDDGDEEPEPDEEE